LNFNAEIPEFALSLNKPTPQLWRGFLAIVCRSRDKTETSALQGFTLEGEMSQSPACRKWRKFAINNWSRKQFRHLRVMKGISKNPAEASATLRAKGKVLRHLIAALHGEARRYRKRLEASQRHFSQKAVHESRIQTRRLLAIVELLVAFLSIKELKKSRRALKLHLDLFDDLRDTQVQLTLVKPLRKDFPAARSFHLWLRQREEQFIRAVRRGLRKIKMRRLSRRMEQYEEELRTQEKRISSSRALRMMEITIQLAFAEVDRRRKLVQAEDTRTIHRTRIAFKRFRYMVEASVALLSGISKGYRQEMHDYQTCMGEIQDAEVLLAAFDAFAAGQSEGAEIRRLRQHFEQRRKDLIQDFLTHSDELLNFWPLSR